MNSKRDEEKSCTLATTCPLFLSLQTPPRPKTTSWGVALADLPRRLMGLNLHQSCSSVDFRASPAPKALALSFCQTSGAHRVMREKRG